MPWLDRQSFLGKNSEAVLRELTVGFIGLGGGNSHTVQQSAHIGLGTFILVDDDHITSTNLNRLIGGTKADIKNGTQKTAIAERLIKTINPDANVECHDAKWQEVGDYLKRCDIIVGGVDNVRSKDELEAFCRRFLIPYIDMGLDVHHLKNQDEYLVAGQVLLSMPERPCLRCLQIVTDKALADEARNYGDAGGNPQVVWPNGVLASVAVGIIVQLVSPWHKKRIESAYYVYDANLNTVVESERLKRLGAKPCPHYPSAAVGDPAFDIRHITSFNENQMPASSLWRRLLKFIRSI